MGTRRIWLIDGHNMIFAMRRLQELQLTGHGEEARRILVDSLRQFAHARRDDVLVVFDGDDLPGNPDALREPFLDIVYAGRGEGGADARIIHAARSKQKQGRRVTVVTDDVSTLASKLPEGADHLGVQAFNRKYLEAPVDRIDKRIEGDFSEVEKELESLATLAEPPSDSPFGQPRTVARQSGHGKDSRETPAVKDATRERIRRKRQRGRLRQERLLKRRPRSGRGC